MRRISDDFARDVAELRTIARRLRDSEEADELRLLRLDAAVDALAEDLDAEEPEAFDLEVPMVPTGEAAWLPAPDGTSPYPF